MVTTTWVRAAIAFSVDGCDASAVMSGHDCALSPSVSRTASSLSWDRPASAMRASPPDLGQVLGGQLAGETGRAVQDDVEFTLPALMALRYPSVSGGSTSSPRT